MRIRRLAPPDREPVLELLHTGGTFTADEVAVAMEVVDACLSAPGRAYHVLVCEAEDETLVGYVCYGPTPMTLGTWDLYWIATRAGLRGKGIGSRLVYSMEADLLERGARIVRIETSQMDEDEAARSFYARHGYREVGRIHDFYRHGDDLVTLARRLDLPAETGIKQSAARPAGMP